MDDAEAAILAMAASEWDREDLHGWLRDRIVEPTFDTSPAAW